MSAALLRDLPAPRRSAAALALALACGACSDGPSAPPPARRVIVITCDTLRADHLGTYGYQRPTSPRFDAFARESVVFDDAWSTAPWTGPALSALWTGRLPEEIGVPGGNRFPLPPAATTLAEIVRDAGLRTGAIVSNWVLRRPPPELGDAGVAQGFEHFDDRMEELELNRRNQERTAPATTDAAIAWLHARKAAGEDRFLLWVHYQDPHGPYTPPAAKLETMRAPAADEQPLPVGTTQKGKGQIPAYQVVASERLPAQYRARYDAEIAHFDEHLGRLLDWVRAAGWLDDALVVLSADHGESLGENGYWFCHGENVQPEVVRVPFVVRFPKGSAHVRGAASGGFERVAAPAGHLDLWPTILDALGLERRPNRGLSLFANELPRTRIQQQTLGRSPRRFLGFGDGRWRVVIEGGQPARLYDLAADPHETRDVAADHPERVAELMRLREEYVARATGPALDASPIGPSPEVDRALHDLGYTDGDDH